MKWKLLLVGLLVVGLLAGGTASALSANTAESLTPLTESEVEELVDELEAVDGMDILPAPMEGRTVKITGGFRGVWGIGEDETADPLGWLVGIYGTVVEPDGTSYGFLGGIYMQKGERIGGLLVGKYADGAFWGTWHSFASETSGQFGGTYTAETEDVEAIVNRFVGKWEISDGETSGYMKGTWAQRVRARRTGRFQGAWSYNDDEIELEAVRPEADGRLRGHYGIIKLADGTAIRMFRGGWNSEEGSKDKLIGIGIRGHFAGVWKTSDGDVGGYLTGAYREHRFRGVWGTMGEEPAGKLWGRYGRMPQVEAEAEPIPEPQVEAQPIN